MFGKSYVELFVLVHLKLSLLLKYLIFAMLYHFKLELT